MSRNFYKGDGPEVTWVGFDDGGRSVDGALIVMNDESLPGHRFTVFNEGLRSMLYNAYMAGRSHGRTSGRDEARGEMRRSLGINQP